MANRTAVCDCGSTKDKRANTCPRCAERRCCDCGVLLGRHAAKAGSRRCRKHATRTEASRAGRSAAMKAIFANDERHRERVRLCARHLHTPEVLAKRPRSKGRRRNAIRRTRWAWCPEEYWELYQRLRKRQLPDPNLGRSKVNGKFVGRIVGSAKAREIVERGFGGPLVPISMTTPQMLRAQCGRAGAVVQMSPQQTTLVCALLLQHPDRYASLPELIEAVWPDPDAEPDCSTRALLTYIHKLRGKGIPIVRARSPSGIGYRIPREARAEPVRWRR